ncbi:hypothetical protein EMCRGX_G011311 [Ephydatia muelleri]
MKAPVDEDEYRNGPLGTEELGLVWLSVFPPSFLTSFVLGLDSVSMRSPEPLLGFIKQTVVDMVRSQVPQLGYSAIPEKPYMDPNCA